MRLEYSQKKTTKKIKPPLMYGIGAYFAIQDAVKEFNKNYKLKFHSPFTPEKVLLSLYS
jgi:xanthine dehydrogenase large subunit